LYYTAFAAGHPYANKEGIPIKKYKLLDVLDDKNINSLSITSVFPSLQYACTNVAKERNKMDKGLYLSEK